MDLEQREGSVGLMMDGEEPVCLDQCCELRSVEQVRER